MLELRQISKRHAGNGRCVQVLEDVSFSVREGEMCALIGPSGSGKSTLLNIMGLLDTPDQGAVFHQGVPMHQADERTQAIFRNRHIGFVFQAFHLLGHLSALDNIGLPLLYRGMSKTERRRLARPWLERVGLGDRASHLPAALSGGQQQRVAIARALIGAPRLVLADEPTGNLDPASTNDIITLLTELNREAEVSVVIVTHDRTISARCHTEIAVSEGQATILRRDKCTG